MKNTRSHPNRIAELRKEFRMSQHELGEKLYISQKAISKYENGINEPRQDLLIRMSEIFDASIDYILGTTPLRSRTSYENMPSNLLPDEERCAAYELDELRRNAAQLKPEDRRMLLALARRLAAKEA